MFRICSLLIVLLMPHALWADVSGPLRVIDGDTIAIGDYRVRLHGIDAPEMAQTCDTEHGVSWHCGRAAAQFLHANFAGQNATCQEMDIDRYGRIVGRCLVRGIDLSQLLVAQGWAVAYLKYSEDYAPDQAVAQTQDIGIWAGSLQNPAAYRAFGDAPFRTCSIKGNISPNGRIYHVAGQRYYARTNINEAQGERWFCTVQDAQQAGWRAVRG